MNEASLLRALFLLISMAVAAPAQGPLPAAGYDLVILGGRVMDPESGTDAVRNLGISAGKIEAVTTEPISGKSKINAKGLVVAPGFIDLHQHGQDPVNYAIKAADGVTTALELELGTEDIDAWYGERKGKARINYGASVGHIRARMKVMKDPGYHLPTAGSDAARRAATPAEISAIKGIIERGLKRGALAVGFGPAYTPAASRMEIVEMFRVAARHGAVCDIHVRSEAGPGQINAGLGGFEEAIAAAAISGAPLHFAHIQSTGGPDDTLPELAMIADARSHGLDVTVEAYPYTHGMTSIQAALFDHREGEPDSFFASLFWPATGEHLTRKTFAEHRKAGGFVIVPCNTEKIVDAAIASPLTIIASDGNYDKGAAHPRNAGTYSRILGHYVRETRALSLMDALRKMTLMPARRLEGRAPVMKNKGRIRPGADADITIFDPARVIDKSTYQKPTTPPEGIRFVLVGGIPVLKDGKLVEGAAPGQGVRAPVQ